jgi:hypothetical protein
LPSKCREEAAKLATNRTGKSAVRGAYFCYAGSKQRDDRRAEAETFFSFGCEEGNAAMSIVPLLAQSAFDPEFIETLVAAYEDAWRELEQSGSTFASPRYRRAAQEIVAKRIIEMAQRGERERAQLAKDAAAYLARSYA